MKLKTVFWNKEENRLRTAWRLCLFFLVLFGTTMALGLISGVLVVVLRFVFPNIANDPTYTNIFQMMLITLVMIIGTWIAARWVDRRKFSSLGFEFGKKWWLDFGFGAFLGFFLMLFIFLTELTFGWINVESYVYAHPDYTSFWIAILVYAFQFICVGIYEEIFTRSYLLINLSEGFSFIKDRKTGLLISYLLTSSIFGLMHAFNPDSTPASVLNIMVAGLFLGLGMVLTGRMGLSIGLHITWNFFQGNIFGFPVSGIDTGVSMIQITQRGNELITGGSFGPEGGLISIFAILIGIACILGWVKWRDGAIRLGVLSNLFQTQQPIVAAFEVPEN
jgi:membrane protease YdiL (CAAX protease family)